MCIYVYMHVEGTLSKITRRVVSSSIVVASTFRRHVRVPTRDNLLGFGDAENPNRPRRRGGARRGADVKTPGVFNPFKKRTMQE